MFLPLESVIGWRATGVWLLAMLGLELALRSVLSRQIAGGGPLLRLQRIGISQLMSASWIGLAAVLWLDGEPGMRVASLGLCAGILLYAHSACSKAPAQFAIVGGPAILAMLALPLIGGGLSPTALLAVEGSALICVAHTMMSVANGYRAHRQLTAATADLVRQRELAECASQAKSDFLAMMSHELRTPMNGVLGLAHALQRTELDARQASLLEGVTRSGDALMRILNDILDLTKIEAGKMAISPEPAALHDLLRQSHDLFAETALAKGIDLRLAVEPGTPDGVVTDPLRLRQILLNLVSNAVKFTEAGEVVLSVRLVRRLDDGRCELAFAVRDTGPGLSEAARAELFRPFSQGEAGFARTYGGTGLGLSISRQLARAMGGELSAVAGEPGAGTTFELVLPLQDCAPPGAEASDEAGPVEALDGPTAVLVAEDNAINRAVVRALLESAGCALTFAENGALAVEALSRGRFDLVLMDVHMPVMDGVAAVREIRSGRAGDPGVPVIALTADTMTGDRQRFLAAGFNAHVAKPIRPAELLGAMQAVLAGPAEEALSA
jgi:signal transduction histidine kinase/CheY-like chemotaxis protein